MSRLCCAIVWALVAKSTFACGDFATYSVVGEDGTQRELILPKEIDATPSWLAGGREPPLPIGKAASIALDWAKSNYTRFDSIEINTIDLRRYGCSTLRDRWFYIVNFRPYIDGASVVSSTHFVAVLMNGQVVAPRTTTRKNPSDKTMEPTR